MNFEFLKDLRGLNYVYENCSNAEKLAMTMPVQSVFTARKSAELLAKFIFLAAHNEQMETMNFVDILDDPAVREFIDDRKVMNAFHYIRKSGNRAVHGDDQETAEEAIEVLEDLHFVAGETACMLGLIDDYPIFNDKISVYPEAKYVDDKDIEEKAQKMFLDYVEKYDAQKEREHYYQTNIDNLIEEFDSMGSGMLMVPGDVDLNEVIEFKHKPVHESSIKPIQAYFGFLGIRALKKLRGELYRELEGRELRYNAELTIYGENGYTTTNLPEFVYGIMYDLPSADGFKITSTYYGPSVAPWFEANSKEIKSEFSQEVAEIGLQEEFTYSVFEFLYNHGEGWVGKFENGAWVDLKPQYSSKIVNKEYPKEWFCWYVNLAIEFDFEKYSAILQKLRECVKKHVPSDQYEYCESAWEDDPQILINGVSWPTKKLSLVQDFLNEINAIIEPIKDECDCGADGHWYYYEFPFAVATWDWTDDGFKVMGTET